MIMRTAGYRIALLSLAGGLSANGWPRLMAKLGRPAFGDVIAIFALPEKTSHE
jgi:hypothetical protein